MLSMRTITNRCTWLKLQEKHTKIRKPCKERTFSKTQHMLTRLVARDGIARRSPWPAEPWCTAWCRLSHRPTLGGCQWLTQAWGRREANSGRRWRERLGGNATWEGGRLYRGCNSWVYQPGASTAGRCRLLHPGHLARKSRSVEEHDAVKSETLSEKEIVVCTRKDIHANFDLNSSDNKHVLVELSELIGLFHNFSVQNPSMWKNW